MQDTEDMKDAPDVPDADELERLRTRIQAIASAKEKQAQDVAGKRKQVELRWIDDIRQYYGRYDEVTEAKLKDPENRKSRVFVQKTRPKTDIWAARIYDMLFPTDEKNWGIQPTPVPELSAILKQSVDQQATPEDQQAPSKAVAAQKYLDAAKRAAEGMERECDDQLTECRYAAQARDAIDDACKVGTGIIKGPIDSGKAVRRWVKPVEIDEATGQPIEAQDFVLTDVNDTSPAYRRVSYWSFFPDPDATTIEEAEFTFERHILTGKQLKKWARRPGFDEDACRRLLEEGPNKSVPDYLTTIRAITQEDQTGFENRYVVWEYRGPLEKEDLQDLFLSAQDDEGYNYTLEIDPLSEVNVVLYVCQGEVLKFGIHHLDSDECIYSVFNFSKDDASIWGWGVPAMMRDSQSAMNAGWRMMMDNGGISAGPQIIVNKAAIEPEDGDWTLKPFKVWTMKDSPDGNAEPFIVRNIDSHQVELANIIKIANDFIDEEVALPAITQGEQGGQVGNTVGGLAILMNSANVIFRRVVKNWDDDVTVPVLRRLYDWNMQFSKNDEIKGDMKVDARGSSVLLIREIQSQNLLAVLERFTQNPVLGPMTKGQEAYRKLIQSMNLSADDIVKSQEEIDADAKKEQEAAAQQGQQQDPTIEAKLQIAQIESDTRLKVAELEREIAMIQMAEKQNMGLEELRAKLNMQQAEHDNKERIFAAEAGFKAREAQARGGGAIPAGTRFPP